MNNFQIKRLLVITNAITISLLLIIVGRHFIFKWKNNSRKIKAVKIPEQNRKEPCQYSLEYFDFHYKKEIEHPKIIMLGNSLIRRGNWDSLLGRKDVINRGISGDHLPCICERLKYLKNSSAKICFIEGGINDLPWRNTDTLFNYYKKIVRFWQSENKVPVINLLLYISPKAGITFPSRKNYQAINDSVSKINYMLISFSRKNKLDIIDLNTSVSDTSQKVLLNQFTIDGVHLTNRAYDLWTKQIEIILKKHRI